jgi:hypothetical protein
MKANSVAAAEWIVELPPNTWIKVFFSDFPKCDMPLNNHSGVFNSYILEAGEMPMLSMLETIFHKIMRRIVSKQKEAESMTGTICPNIRKKLYKFTEWSANCGVEDAGNGIYHVTTIEKQRIFNVDMVAKTCDCRKWQLSGIPCHHAIACCRSRRIS